jgi:ligand-binding sensor domain-containing protein
MAAVGAAMSAACGPATDLPAGWTVLKPPQDVAALAIAGPDVWAGGRDGLYRIDRLDGAPKSLPGNPPAFRYVRDLALAVDGTLWIAHGAGVTRFADGEWAELSAGAASSPCHVLLPESAAVLVGCESGLYRAGRNKLEPIALPQQATFQSVDALFRDSSGRLWVGSASPVHGGLLSLADGRWRVYSDADGLPHRSINGFCETREGLLWLASGFAGRGGAAWFDGDRWHAVASADGLISDDVRSIHEDADGRLWFSSEFQGSAVIANGRVAVLTPGAGLAGPEVKALAVDADGTCWIGTDRGLNRVEDPSPILDTLWRRLPTARIAEAAP